MRISDWSSDVCSSDLQCSQLSVESRFDRAGDNSDRSHGYSPRVPGPGHSRASRAREAAQRTAGAPAGPQRSGGRHEPLRARSEEHTSELQSLMRISCAVFCLKKKTKSTPSTQVENKRE